MLWYSYAPQMLSSAQMEQDVGENVLLNVILIYCSAEYALDQLKTTFLAQLI